MPVSYSPVRYPGGKAKLYDYVKLLLNANDLIGETYIEPFAGGSGLALKLLMRNDVKRIIINDFDPAIYAFWYCVLNHTEELINKFETTPITLKEWDNQKKIYLDYPNNTVEYGFATFFLNRTNRSGVIKGGMIGGRSQDGEYTLDARFNKEDLINKILDISERKDQIILENMDAKEMLSSGFLKKYYKTFINFDPPYVVKGSQLYKNSFDEKDHRELYHYIKKCKRKWIVTYDICPLTTELYKDFRHDILDYKYSINEVKDAQEYIFFSDNLELPK